jgi:pre-mRNA-splicing factor CDC5/CEF1
LRRELKAGLSSLPSPQHEYTLELQGLPEEEEQEEVVEEDAAAIKERKAREAEAARLAAEKKKSKVRGEGVAGFEWCRK